MGAPDWEDVFPIKNGDIPDSYVSLLEGNIHLLSQKPQEISNIMVQGGAPPRAACTCVEEIADWSWRSLSNGCLKTERPTASSFPSNAETFLDRASRWRIGRVYHNALQVVKCEWLRGKQLIIVVVDNRQQRSFLEKMVVSPKSTNK